MIRLHRLAFIAAVLVAAGLAYSQSTLGNMFKLGGSTVYNLPTSSSYTVGALIYDLDSGYPLYNNGSSWQSLVSGGSAGDTFWYDGGFTTSSGGSNPTQNMATQTSQLRNADGGALVILGSGSDVAVKTALLIANRFDNQSVGSALAFTNNSTLDPEQARSWIFASNTSSGGMLVGTNFHSASPWHFGTGGPGTTATRVLTVGSTVQPYAVVNSQVAAGSNAFAIQNNTARYDFGDGTSDYATSDGTGIETPSYWESTRSISTGAGLIANSATLTTTATTSFTSTNVALHGEGSLAMDTTRGLVTKRSGGVMAQLAQHVVYDEQTFTWRVMGVGTAVAPTFAEYLLIEPTKRLIMYWSEGGASTNVQFDRFSLYPLTVTGETQQSGYSATEGATTLTRYIDADLNLSYCQRIHTDETSLTGVLYWFGLVDTVPNNSATLPGKGIAFRYVDGTDTNWQLCTHNGTSQTCVNTGLAASIKQTAVFCFQKSSTTLYVYVDGAYVGTTSTNVPSATLLGNSSSVRNTNAGTRTLYLNTLHIGAH